MAAFAGIAFTGFAFTDFAAFAAFAGFACFAFTGFAVFAGGALRTVLAAVFLAGVFAEGFFAVTGRFAWALTLAGAAFFEAGAFFAGSAFLTGRATGFAAAFFGDGFAVRFEAGLDVCFRRAAALGLTPFRVLAAAFFACTLAINLSRRFPS